MTMFEFKRGDIVRCVDDSVSLTPQFVTDWVEMGKNYTIRDNADFAGVAGVYLEEIVSKVREPWGDGEQSFLASRFELVERR